MGHLPWKLTSDENLHRKGGWSAMKKLFVSQSLVEVEALKELLEGAGIPCMLKNRQGSSLAGEVPFVEVFPELWVNDEDFDEANTIVSARNEVRSPTESSWICAGCGEPLSGEFTTCWKCGVERALGHDA